MLSVLLSPESPFARSSAIQTSACSGSKVALCFALVPAASIPWVLLACKVIALTRHAAVPGYMAGLGGMGWRAWSPSSLTAKASPARGGQSWVVVLGEAFPCKAMGVVGRPLATESVN